MMPNWKRKQLQDAEDASEAKALQRMGDLMGFDEHDRDDDPRTVLVCARCGHAFTHGIMVKDGQGGLLCHTCATR